MTAPAPARTREQRTDALQRANEVRARRAKMKQAMARSPGNAIRVACALLNNPPWWLTSMQIAPFLDTIPYLGPRRIGRIMLMQHLSPDRRISVLSDRQRRELVTELTRIHNDRREKR